jgi:Xaa-Pro aminopeptidase
MIRNVWLYVATTILLAGLVVPVRAQRLGYPPEEFIARREALCQRLESGTVLLFGNTMPALAARNHQDHDFYYLTGNEDLNSVLVMDVATRAAYLFLPKQGAGEIRSDGTNWLEDPTAAERWGFAAIAPLYTLNEFLARRRNYNTTPTLWVRLSERDEISQSRSGKAINLARQSMNMWSAQPSLDAFRVELLRQHYPFYQLKDISPHVDRMRMIKTAREIEILKLNGRIAAEAINRAIAVTEPGRFEYEIEAEATYHHVRNGVQRAGYGAIVGSGANGNIWHYRDNGSQVAAGEMIVMDYGGSLDYMIIDITRTWPVSGEFDELQLRAYECALEALKAITEAMRPGATRAGIREITREIYDRHGFADQSAPSAGHFVGMSVHDVGDAALPLEPGMVIAVEPIIEIKEKQLHVRIEDTILVTEGEPVVLTAASPKEVDELLAFMRQAREARSRATH